MSPLTKRDHEAILNFYSIDAKNMSSRELAKKAENLLADKLCRCIKKVQRPKEKEDRAIATCRKSIFHRKGVDFHHFTCKEKADLIPRKRRTRKLHRRKARNTRKRASR
jgi:hypothetical protein